MRPPHRLSLGEIEQWARHAFPFVRKEQPVGASAVAWRHALQEAMLQLPGTFVLSDERGGVGEVGTGPVWQLDVGAAAPLLVVPRPAAAKPAPAVAVAPAVVDAVPAPAL